MINVSARLTTMNVGPNKGFDRFVLTAPKYSRLSEEKVIEEAALRSGLSKHVIRAAWGVCGEVVAAWCMEGHSCPLPGLGHMRFGIRADSAGNIEDVSDKLIRMRRIHFVPSVAIKEEMAKTGVSITCYDKKGKR